MKSFLSAFLGAVGSLLALVLFAAFLGVLAGVAMWSADAVSGLLP